MPAHRNPRPRKYASDAERQKAFRDRWASVEVRIKPETLATLDKLAESGAWGQGKALHGARQELLYAMIQFALTNHDWRNPTFTTRRPTVRDMETSGDFMIHVEYESDAKRWRAELRDAQNQMALAADPLYFDRRPTGLTWESFK